MKICVVKTVPAQLGQCRSCRSQLLSSKKTAFYFAVDTFFSPFPVFYCFFFLLLFLLHSPSALAKISGTTVQPQQALRPLRSLPLCICTWVEQLLFFCSFFFFSSASPLRPWVSSFMHDHFGFRPVIFICLFVSWGAEPSASFHSAYTNKKKRRGALYLERMVWVSLFFILCLETWVSRLRTHASALTF